MPPHADLYFRERTGGYGLGQSLTPYRSIISFKAISNSAVENSIGSQIQIGDMQITGPSSSVPGAFNLSDSGISLTQGGVTIFQAEMTNDLLIPDPLRPGYAQVQGSMTFLEEGEQPGMSQYIDQYFGDSSASDLFFETSILSQTNGLTQDGTAYGNADIESVAPVPEPVTVLLILPAGLLAPRCRRRQVRTR